MHTLPSLLSLTPTWMDQWLLGWLDGSMIVWMIGWMFGWFDWRIDLDGLMYDRMDWCMIGWIDVWLDVLMYDWMYWCLIGWMDPWLDRSTDGLMDDWLKVESEVCNWSKWGLE
jgi:hypothetical protein